MIFMEFRSTKILKAGSPQLHEVSTPWDFSDKNKESLDQLLQKLKLVMREECGIGLSAPQIGVQKRIFVMEVKSSDRYINLPKVPFQVFINPVILKYEKRTCDFMEGCLSVDDFRIIINRPRGLWVRWQDQSGRFYKQKLSGIRARIFQHEFDHLDGILISDYLI